MKIYKSNALINLPLVFIPLLLLIPLFETDIDSQVAIAGIAILSGIAVFIFVIPFGLSLKVSGKTVETSAFGLTLTRISASEVLDIKYGSIIKGGLGVGKGLIITTPSKVVTVGAKMYGTEAIESVKRALSN